MSFLRLICISRNIQKRKNDLLSEKLNSQKKTANLATDYAVDEKIRHKCFKCRKCCSDACRLSGTSCLYRTWVKLKYDGTIENYILKSIVGFVSGFMLTYLFFMFFILLLNFKLSTATIMCSVFGCILTIGLAFSYKIRCIVLLILPQFFTKRGRQALLAYAFILAITGPAKNTLHNMGILSESLACGQEQLKETVRQILDLIRKPFHAIKDAIKSVVEATKVIVKKIKEILLSIARVILSILRVIKSAFEFLSNIVSFCNKKIGTPFQRCSRVFENAITDCNAKLGPMFNWLCSITYLLKSVCYLVKPLDYICMLIDFISDSIVGTVKKKLKTFARHVKTMFYAKLVFSHSFKFSTNQSKNMREVSGGILTEIRDRIEHIIAVFDLMSCATSLFFLFIIIKAFYYRYKYLTNERFDNHFITRSFREIDLTRAKQSKETVLPLNHRERHKFIVVNSIRLVKSEKQAFCKAAVILCMVTVKLSTHMMADYALYWTLSLIRYHAKFQSPAQAPNTPTVYVSGSGLLGDLLRSIVKAFQPIGLNLQIDTVPCLPDPIPPDYDRYLQIVFLLLLCWLLVILEPYGLRLRHWVMCYYHPDRARERSVWLYNHIIRSRSSFLKFARRQLRKKVFGYKKTDKVTCREYLRAKIRCKCVRRLLCLGADHQDSCLLCGAVFRKDDEPPFYCKTPNCPGKYCAKCFIDLQNLCTVCLDPIEYGDLSDIDEEKDSSDDNENKENNAAKKKKKEKKRKKKSESHIFKNNRKNTDGDDDGDADTTQLIDSSNDTSSSSNNGSDSESKHEITSSDTDYSFSYQSGKDYAPKDNTASSPRMHFVDIERQRNPDYATMETFRTGSKDTTSYHLRSGDEKLFYLEDGFCTDQTTSSLSNDKYMDNATIKNYSMNWKNKFSSSSSLTPLSNREERHPMYHASNIFPNKIRSPSESIAPINKKLQAELMLNLAEIENEESSETLSSGNPTSSSSRIFEAVTSQRSEKTDNVNCLRYSTFAKHDNPGVLAVALEKHPKNVTQCSLKSNEDKETTHKNKNDVASATKKPSDENKTRVTETLVDGSFDAMELSKRRLMAEMKRKLRRKKIVKNRRRSDYRDRCSYKSDSSEDNVTPKFMFTNIIRKFSDSILKTKNQSNYDPLEIEMLENATFSPRVNMNLPRNRKISKLPTQKTSAFVNIDSDTSSIDSEILFELEKKRGMLEISPRVLNTNLPDSSKTQILSSKFNNVKFDVMNETPRIDNLKISPRLCNINNYYDNQHGDEKKSSKESHIYDTPCTKSSPSLTASDKCIRRKNSCSPPRKSMQHSTPTYHRQQNSICTGNYLIDMEVNDKRSKSPYVKSPLNNSGQFNENKELYRQSTYENMLPVIRKKNNYNKKIKDYYSKIKRRPFDNPLPKKYKRKNKCMAFISKMFQKKRKSGGGGFQECENTSKLLSTSGDSSDTSLSSCRRRKLDFNSSSSSSSLTQVTDRRFPGSLDSDQCSNISIAESLMGQNTSVSDNLKHMRGGTDLPISTYLDRRRLNQQTQSQQQSVQQRPLVNADELFDTDSSLSLEEIDRIIFSRRYNNTNHSATKSNFAYHNPLAEEEYRKEIEEERRAKEKEQQLRRKEIEEALRAKEKEQQLRRKEIAENWKVEERNQHFELKELEESRKKQETHDPGSQNSNSNGQSSKEFNNQEEYKFIDNPDFSRDFNFSTTQFSEKHQSLETISENIPFEANIIEDELTKKYTTFGEEEPKKLGFAIEKPQINQTSNLNSISTENLNDPQLPATAIASERLSTPKDINYFRRPVSEPALSPKTFLASDQINTGVSQSSAEKFENNTEIQLYAREPPERDFSPASSYTEMKNSNIHANYLPPHNNYSQDYRYYNDDPCCKCKSDNNGVCYSPKTPNSVDNSEPESAKCELQSSYSPCKNYNLNRHHHSSSSKTPQKYNRCQKASNQQYYDSSYDLSNQTSELSMQCYPDVTAPATNSELYTTDDQYYSNSSSFNHHSEPSKINQINPNSSSFSHYSEPSKINHIRSIINAETPQRERIAHCCQNNCCPSNKKGTPCSPRNNYNSNQTSETDDFAYQSNIEFNNLVNELGEKLFMRNKQKVQKTLQEFEKHSRENKGLRKPIFEDSEAGEEHSPRNNCRFGRQLPETFTSKYAPCQMYDVFNEENVCETRRSNSPPPVPPRGHRFEKNFCRNANASPPTPPPRNVPGYEQEQCKRSRYVPATVPPFQDLNHSNGQFCRNDRASTPISENNSHRETPSRKAGFVERLAKHMDPNSKNKAQKYPKFASNVPNSRWELNCKNEWIKIGSSSDSDCCQDHGAFNRNCHSQGRDRRRAHPPVPPPRISSCRDRNMEYSPRHNHFESNCDRTHMSHSCRCKNCKKKTARY